MPKASNIYSITIAKARDAEGRRTDPYAMLIGDVDIFVQPFVRRRWHRDNAD